MIIARFHDIYLQERVLIWLELLRYVQFPKPDDDELQTLDSLSADIFQNFSNIPSNCLTPEYNLELLERSVTGLPWAREPINRLVDHRDYDTFLGVLSNHLQKCIREKELVEQDSRLHSPVSSNVKFYYEDRYGRDGRHKRCGS